jgi:hypothetical protein
MCDSPAFTLWTQWLFDPGDEPTLSEAAPHRGAALARSLGVPVDGEPLICPFCGEPDPCACMSKKETPGEKEKRLLKELGYE